LTTGLLPARPKRATFANKKSPRRETWRFLFEKASGGAEYFAPHRLLAILAKPD
jgi:hypothetical protein